MMVTVTINSVAVMMDHQRDMEVERRGRNMPVAAYYASCLSSDMQIKR